METGKIKLSETEAENETQGLSASGSISLVPSKVEEFFNPIHDPDTGRFGEKTGGGGPRVPGEGLTGEQIDGILSAGHRLEDYDTNGKPIAGTDAWRDAHGISKEVYDTRPMATYTRPNDAAINEHYAGLDAQHKNFANRVAQQSEGGIIMVRKPPPGAIEEGFGPIPPQIRPNKKVVLNPKDLAKAEGRLQAAKDRAAQVDKFTGDDIIKERQARVKTAEKELRDVKNGIHFPDEYLAEARNKETQAAKKLSQAQKGKSQTKIVAAEKELQNAQFERRSRERFIKDPQRAIGTLNEEVTSAKRSLERAQANPQAALDSLKSYTKDQVVKKQDVLDGVAVKYLFPKGDGNAARIEVNQDRQNIRNLVSGKGRVYFVMEGNIKADAALTAVKKEDPRAAVVSVPSVSTWPNKTGETEWFTKKYLKDRDVILIPDADGVTNRNVVNQATRLQGKLLSGGAKNVIVASPPLKNGKIETFKLPSGVTEHRKGLDDHLGAGRGTLGDLTFDDSPPPKFDMSARLKAAGVRSHSVTNTNATMNAISHLSGPKGIGRVSIDSIEQYSGLPQTSVKDSVKRLEKMGVIKQHHIFEPKALGRGRRIPTMEYDEAKRITRKAGVPTPDFDQKWVRDEDKHEIPAIIEILDNEYIHRPGRTKSLADQYKSLKRSQPSERIATRRAVPSRPGRRIVRSAAGARRYGVPIGSPIPEAASNETGVYLSGELEEGIRLAMDTNSESLGSYHAQGLALDLSSDFARTETEVVSIGVIEFYNPVHEPDTGRFGASRGGGGKGAYEPEGPLPPGGTRLDDLSKRQRASVKDPMKGDSQTRNKAARKKATGLSAEEIQFYVAAGALVAAGLIIAGSAAYPAVARQRMAFRLRNVPVLKTKAGFSLKGKQGKTLHLIDKTGKVDKTLARQMLKDLDDINVKAPLAGGAAPRIVVQNRDYFDNSTAYVVPGESSYRHFNVGGFRLPSGKIKGAGRPVRTIHVNLETYNDANIKTPYLVRKGHFTAGHKRNAARHTIYHEYGHLHDLNAERAAGLRGGDRAANLYRNKRSSVFSRGKFANGMSDYGRTDDQEGYAEVFADYFSGGRTDSTASYARNFGW